MRTAETLQGIVGLVAVVALVCGPLQWVCTDYLRETAFRERDRLFDLARTGKIRFDDPVYREARERMNAMIRFAHLSTFGQILCHAYLSRLPRNDMRTNGLSVLADKAENPESADVLATASRALNKALVTTMVLRSPVVWIAAPVLLLVWGLWPRSRIAKLNEGAAAIAQDEAMRYRRHAIVASVPA